MSSTLKQIIRVILIVLLGWFYAQNIINNIDNWQAVVIYNRVNFILLVIILYLMAGFIPFFEYLCAIVLIAGLIFHGHMYYQAYVSEKEYAEALEKSSSSGVKQKRCEGDTNWYKRLNDSCY